MPARRTANLLLVLAGLLLVSAGLLFIRTARAGARPRQPLGFPHRNHLENQIDCSFCHAHYEDHAAAGMPRVSLCATCHAAMPQESADSRKLFEYSERGEEIPWVRLYRLPDYSVFSHKWHVRAGIACGECHGAIGESVEAVRHLDYKMAWCMDCHRERGASLDCLVCHK